MAEKKNQHDGVFSHVNEKKWKYLSIGLMGILATGLLAPQAYADTLSTIQSIVTDIQSKVNNSTYGLQAIKNAITGVKTDTQIIRGDLYSFKTNVEPKVDVKVSTRASQTSVDSLQGTVNGINGKVDNIQNSINNLGSGGTTNLSKESLVAIHCDSITTNPMEGTRCSLQLRQLDGANFSNGQFLGASFLGSHLKNVNFSNAKLQAVNFGQAELNNANFTNAILANVIFGHADLTNVNLTGANLTEANFDGADLTGAIFTNCVGDPIGTPAAGTLPDCA